MTSQPLLKRKEKLAALVARADVPRLLYDGYVES